MKLEPADISFMRKLVAVGSAIAPQVLSRAIDHIDALEAELSRWQSVAGKLAEAADTCIRVDALRPKSEPCPCYVCQAMREYENLTAGQKGSE